MDDDGSGIGRSITNRGDVPGTSPLVVDNAVPKSLFDMGKSQFLGGEAGGDMTKILALQNKTAQRSGGLGWRIVSERNLVTQEGG